MTRRKPTKGPMAEDTVFHNLDGTPDTGCGLKIMHRSTFLALPQFDHMHRFLPALFQRAGASVLSLPVAHRPRERGSSKYGMFDRLWVGIVDIFGVMWLRRRWKPGLVVIEGEQVAHTGESRARH